MQLDDNLRTPYAQNWYLGVQHSLTSNLLIEVGQAGSVGRKLVSRDLINRYVNSGPSINPNLDEITYLTNAGNSNFLDLELALRHRYSRGLQYQLSYTYSHAIDNQSDIYEGIRTLPPPASPVLASFTSPLDARVDRGNANFDQRHNLVFNAIWDLPVPDLRTAFLNRLLRAWAIGFIGAYRSGFPLTVISDISDYITQFRNNRVNFIGTPGQNGYLSPAPPVTGGVQWLDPQQFAPVVDQVGTLGRGAIKGPGFWNYDFALMRNFGFSRDKIRLQFRAEFYNLFNHANLSQPVTFYGADGFGQARYGLNPTYSRFGDLPLSSPSRTIQFGIRVQF